MEGKLGCKLGIEIPSCDQIRYTIDPQLCGVANRSSLIGDLAGEGAAVGVVHGLNAQHARPRAQLGCGYADVRRQVLALHAPTDSKRRISFTHRTEYLSICSFVDRFTAERKWNDARKS